MSMRILATTAGLGLLLAFAGSAPATAESSLVGNWSGGGTVRFPSGAVEKANCRATYRRSGSGYTMSGVCATPSGRAEQTATLRRVSANKYAGDFHNPEYGMSGSISVTVSGNSQTVYLSSDSASASIRLRR